MTIAALAGLAIALIGLLGYLEPGVELLRRFLLNVVLVDPLVVIRLGLVVLLRAGVAALIVWYLGYRSQQAFRDERWSLEKQRRQAQSRWGLEQKASPGDVVDAALPTAPDVAPVPEPPEELVRACAERESVLYAGLGIGAQAGLPTWREALELIVRRADEEGLWRGGGAEGTLDPTQLSRAVRTAVNAGELAAVADLRPAMARDR